MNRDGWTIILFRGAGRAQRQYTLSARGARVLLWTLGVGGVFVACAGAFFAVDSGVRTRAALLSRENDELKGRIAEIGTQVEDLGRRVAAYDEQNERLRREAGLVGIDAEVYDVGIGGPAAPYPGDGALWPLGEVATGYDLDFLNRKLTLLEESSGETMEAIEVNRVRSDATPSIMPLHGVPSSGFGPRKVPVHGGSSNHRGVDIPGIPGQRIVATAAGEVVFTGRKQGLGVTVIIDHGQGFRTVYGHASRSLVQRGQRVDRRDVIALVGNTGTSTGYHVHYEVHVNGVAMDPTRYFLDSASF